MNHLLRELAPLSSTSWQQIDGEAKARLTPPLAARKLVDSVLVSPLPPRRRRCAIRRLGALPRPVRLGGCSGPRAGRQACDRRAVPPVGASRASGPHRQRHALDVRAVLGRPVRLVAGSLDAARTVPSGIAFGTMVWTGDYVVLPLMRIYKPIWKYDVKTLGDDLSAHLVYGIATAAAFRLFSSS